MTHNATKAQKACIHAMLNKLGLYKQRGAMVASITGGRSDSIADITLEEAKALIQYLKKQDPEEKAAEVMRRKIISMAHEMKWELPNGKADMQRLDAWMVKSSYLHKKLNQYLYGELPALVTQFEKVYSSFLKGI